MEELKNGGPESTSGADESELRQPEMDEVTGGNNGGNSAGPFGPHH